VRANWTNRNGVGAGRYDGPPAERLYAVEPVGVAMIKPVCAKAGDVMRTHPAVDVDNARKALTY